MSISPPRSTQSPNEPRSLLRIIGIFESLARFRQGATLAELSAVLEAPKSSLLLLLRPLVAHKYLSHADSRYALGPSVFRLSAEVLASAGISQIIRPYIEELSERSNESVYLAVIDKDAKQVTYVDGIESKLAVRYSTPIGTTRPLYSSAAGKVLLAFQEEAWCQHYLKTVKLAPFTDKPAVKKSALQKELNEIRSSRISVNIGAMVTGASGIAAPIIKADGMATHALLIVAPSERLLQAISHLRELIDEVATNASQTLGSMPGS